MSSWDNGNILNSLSRPAKRRYNELNNEIESLKQELMMNDLVLKNGLEMRLSSEDERALVAAELFKDRLLTLTQSSRLQVLFVQMGSMLVRKGDQDNAGWNPKRTRFNLGEGNNYNYSNLYTASRNTGYTYTYSNNTIAARNGTTTNKRRRNRKAPQTNTAPVNAPVKVSTAPVKTTTAPVKKLVNPATATVKQSSSTPIKNCKTAVRNKHEKTELNNDPSKNIPSLFSVLRFDNCDRITKKTENVETVMVKTEPNNTADNMHDDLEGHI